VIRRHKPIPRSSKPIARNSRPRRQRKSSLACLKRKLWSLFSSYVKERDGNVCFSCGASGLESHGWHAGHLFPAGAHGIIRYEPKNVHSQCYRCNINLGGNGAAYSDRFIEVYGIEEFRRLSALSRTIKQWRAPEVEELIAALKRGGADYEMLYAERHAVLDGPLPPIPIAVPDATIAAELEKELKTA
jgi:hypothetical protein